MADLLDDTLPAAAQQAVIDLLRTTCDRGLTLSTAESCTGGLVASLITDVPGLSHAFERGFVVYTERAKTEILGVPAALIDRHGAVSRAVALAMAEGGLDNSAADVCLSVTGYAGPSGDGGEAGLVHFGCARRGRETAHRVERFGDIGRGPTRIAAAIVAVAMMREMVG